MYENISDFLFVHFQTLKYAEYSQFHFSIADYCVFVAMLLLSTGTGIYFGYIRYMRYNVFCIIKIYKQTLYLSILENK